MRAFWLVIAKWPKAGIVLEGESFGASLLDRSDDLAGRGGSREKGRNDSMNSPSGHETHDIRVPAVTDSQVLVYRLYGHYSFNSRDGGELVKLVLSEGYSVGEWLNGGKLIVGRRVAVSVEQAIYHGFAQIIK
jgi:hypothetical protein